MEQITKRNEAVKDSKQTRMFCYQCQETAGNKGCTVSGMCGKVPEVANMQDLLIYVTKGLSAVTTKMREKKLAVDENVNHRVTFNLFTTITNANFDNESIKNRIKDTLLEKERLLKNLKTRTKRNFLRRHYGTVMRVSLKRKLRKLVLWTLRTTMSAR